MCMNKNDKPANHDKSKLNDKTVCAERKRLWKYTRRWN